MWAAELDKNTSGDYKYVCKYSKHDQRERR